MQHEFWHERWRNNQIGFHQREINAHLQEFWDRVPMPAGGCVFVPLSGKSRDMLWLRARGHPVLGIEISPIAVRGFFDENSLEPKIVRAGHFERWEVDGLTLLRGDFFDLTPRDIAECGVYDRASLVALPPRMRVRYARHLSAILPPAADSLLVTMEYSQDEMQGPPFSVFEAEVRGLYGAEFDIEHLFSADVLDEYPTFREKGLTRLVEKVFRLSRCRAHR